MVCLLHRATIKTVSFGWLDALRLQELTTVDVLLSVRGKLVVHLTQCRLGWDLPLYQVASWSIQPLAIIHQRYRQGRQTGQQSDNRGCTVLQTVAQKWNTRLNNCWQFSCHSCHPTSSLKPMKRTKKTDAIQGKSSTGLLLSKSTDSLPKKCANYPTPRQYTDLHNTSQHARLTSTKRV